MKILNEFLERKLLTLTIFPEEENERVYADFFEGLQQDISRQMKHTIR